MKEQQMKEIVYQAVQATKSENSGLMRDLKASVAVLETHHVETKEILQRIEQQTIKTNGRVTCLEADYGALKVKLYILAAIIATILFLNGNELVTFISKII
jgi:hypothetical protein